MKGRIFGLIKKILAPDLSNRDDDFKSIKEANNHITAEQKEYVLKTLKTALQDSSNAKISTIHSFCLNIIKSNSDVAKIDTKLDIIKDDEKQKMLSDIVFSVLNEEKNQQIVLDISKNISMFFTNNLINRYVSNTKFRDDFDGFDKKSIDLPTYKALIQELYPLPDVSNAIDELKEDNKRLKWFEDYYNNFKNFDALAWKDVVEDEKAPSLGKTKFPDTTQIKDNLESLIAHYASIDEEKEQQFFQKITNLKFILQQIKKQYDEKLLELGKIDFDTIILKTLEIIPDVDTNFKYIMVDEFQDTNATQFEIVKNACNKDTNLFVVGDAKQSIYSFQGAEIEVFNDAIKNKALFQSEEDMNINHRSDGVVLDSVNNIFKKLLEKDNSNTLIRHNYEAEPQALHVYDKERAKKGSFKFLITSQEYLTQEEKEQSLEKDELDTIANFISNIHQNKINNYAHISELIKKQEKTIAIVFDSSTKMLALKQKLRDKGIYAKVSASEHFYYTKEINDIFHVLKAIDILATSKENTLLSNTQKYFIAGAMRSNIIRCDENSIKQHLQNNTIDKRLSHYVTKSKSLTLSQLVKFIYDDANILGVYTHLGDIEQRTVNLNKFLLLCLDYENSNESSLYNFLSLVENDIYFSDAKEDEAFFKSSGTNSIEICSIHSTKGLAYPLVLLGNSEKGLYSQITSDALKHNNIKVNGERKEIVGFKIEDYTPLSHRVLKQIDKLKHLAEKKRLLYVALTRAKHDIIISATLKQKKDGTLSLREDSYLYMICNSLDIDIDELFSQSSKYSIEAIDEEVSVKDNDIEYIQHDLKPIEFKSLKKESATATNKTQAQDKKTAYLGTQTHKIIELYWRVFKTNSDVILDKMMIFDKEERQAITQNMQAFYKSDIYQLLKDGVEYHFELEFNVDGKTGFIDFIYFDKEKDGWAIVDFKTGSETDAKNTKYQEQLDFYKNIVETLGYKEVYTRLLWLG